MTFGPSAPGRLTRDAKGRVTLAELGNVDSQSDTDWAGFTASQAVETSYDGVDRKLTGMLKNGSTAHALTQYSYNSAGLLECTAVRMNASGWGSLPSDACTLQSAGSDGPDRVTRTTYDAANRPTKVQTAYGTADQADEATTAWNNNGTVASVIDGNGNKTSYEHDDHDRLVKTFYPSPTLGAGTSSSTDYEQLVYDAGGNVTSLRRRDGRSLGFAYDDLGRLSVKTVPGGGCTSPYTCTTLASGQSRDVYYAYDLTGRLTAARFDSTSGSDAVTASWDALGRMTSTTTAMGGTSRSLSYSYDLAGNRTGLTFPDAQAFAFTYDTLGRVNLVKEGTTSVVDVAYRAHGGRHYVSRIGTTSYYYYDSALRLGTLSHYANGSADDVEYGYSWNPAGQVKSESRDNDLYAFGHANAAKAYTVNGLNQATAAAGATLSYDSAGNLTSDGTTTYSYDAENRLVGASNGAVMVYDPLGRLYETSGTANGTTHFLYDGDALVAEYDSSGTMLHRYVHGPRADEVLLAYHGASVSGTTRRYPHQDRLGSVIRETDGATVTYRNAYDEYGVPASTNSGRFQYTGQAWLPDVGLYYYKARIYAPQLGRFMQTDPVGYADGLNWYNYVGSDPVNYVDPTGLSATGPARCSTLTDNCRIIYVNGGEGGYWVRRNGDGEQSSPEDIVVTGKWKWVSSGMLDGVHLSVVFPFSEYHNLTIGKENLSAGMTSAPNSEYERDLARCRALTAKGNPAAASRCYESAGKRQWARENGKPLPPLIEWRTRTESSPIPRNTSNSTGGLVVAGIGGLAAFACFIVEPCGAIVAGALTIGSAGILTTQYYNGEIYLADKRITYGYDSRGSGTYGSYDF